MEFRIHTNIERGKVERIRNISLKLLYLSKNKDMYRPLPEYLTIKQSSIEGLGLFTTEKVPGNLRIGITHIKDDRFENGYSRTPLGGFFNHSENPNCRVVHEGEFIFLETINELDKNEEITASYTLYDPTKIGL